MRLSLTKLQNYSENAFGSVLKGFIDVSSADYHSRFAQSCLAERKLLDLRSWAHNDSEKLVARAKKRGKLSIRERMKYLLDPSAPFLEIGLLAGCQVEYGPLPGAGVVVGLGRISGRLCLVTANDWTVKGGTIYPIGVKKQLRGQDIARKLRVPCVYLVDSGGAFLPLQSEIFPDKNDGGRGFYNEATMGAKGIPQISIVCGSCTAGGAYMPTLCDDAVIVQGKGSLYLGGPPLVKAALGENVTSEELGGADVHCRSSGCTDYMCSDEYEAMTLVKSIVQCTNAPLAPQTNHLHSTAPLFSAKELHAPSCNDPICIKQILARIVDCSAFLEFRELYGSSIVCGFADIAKMKIGLIAATGMCFDTKSAEKTCQFVEMCEMRGLPIVVLQNSSNEPVKHSGNLLKATAQLINVFSTCRSPIISINIGDCFGSDYYSLCGRSIDPLFYFAWPNSKLAMDASGDHLSSIMAADKMWIDDIIQPQQTRNILIQCLTALKCGVPLKEEQFRNIKM